ncbi:MAG: YhbY family RNA-binding protein [Bacillota bacterium]
MLNGKQRNHLKSMATKHDTLLQIGKDGITEGFLNQLDETLEAHELVKINVLNNNYLNPKIVADEILDKVNAEFVQTIGKKLIIYREASEDPGIKLPK